MRPSKTTFSKPVSLLLAAVFLGSAVPAPVLASDRITVSVQSADGKSGAVAPIPVSGTNGRYDRIAAGPMPIALQLSAVLGGDSAGYKILSSELFLKQAGSGQDAKAAGAFEGTVPVRSFAVTRAFDFALEANGPVAQNAIALCNGLAASERNRAQTLKLTVPVLWRVTAGRFNFKWTDYDHVAPSDEIQNNPDFYAGRETAEAETNAEVTVTCEALGGSVAAKPAASQPVIAKPAAAGPITTASLKQSGKPSCDGGMVRLVRSSPDEFLCLCPGNTARVETGVNAFACARKVRLR